MNPCIVHIVKATGVHGTEKHLLTLLPALTACHEVHLLLLHERQQPLHEYVQALQAAGVTVHPVLIRADLDPLCLRELTAHLRALQPALTHTHLMHGDLYGAAAARRAGVRRIVSTKHNDDTFRRLPGIRGLNRCNNRRACALIAISDWVARFVHEVEGVPTEKITTIHYGIDDPGIGAGNPDERRECGIADTVVVLGIIARLVRQKGHRDLLDACAQLQREGIRFELLIVGQGPLERDLQRRVARLRLEDVVRFAGYRPDVYTVLRGIDVFVHPSLWEGFGLSILEAMAAARPIVATRVSAIPELVEPETSALLVSPGDPACLAAALKRCIQDPALRARLGSAARQRWQKHFSREKMVERTLHFYATCLEAY